MLTINADKLKEIAEYLDCGMVCFVHKETGEVVAYPDPLKNPFEEEDVWQEEMQKVEDQYEDFITIKGMEAYEAYKIMEWFIEDRVENKKFANRLRYALSRHKPFQHFKYELDFNQGYRQKWFAYKLEQTMEWVKEQLEVAY